MDKDSTDMYNTKEDKIILTVKNIIYIKCIV